jgi:integrase
MVAAVTAKLKEPYATLVLFLMASGLRIGEVIAIKWSDFEDCVLHVSRRIHDGDMDTVKSDDSNRKLPIPTEFVMRMRGLGGTDWVFCSRAGTPINPGNAMKRYVRPAALELGIVLGGWHDFRHAFSTGMRRNKVNPKLTSSILGHAKVDLAMDIYDHTDVDDLREPLAVMGAQLLRDVTNIDAGA